MSLHSSIKPIDAVVTWVDGEDPIHVQKLEAYLGWRKKRRPKAASKTRYADRGELEYCISSIFRFAPWFRRIFIVTDEQKPAFLSDLPVAYRERVVVVDHKEIFAEHKTCLPTFNSLSIETMLWRIPDLANNFVYFNDDCFLVKEVAPQDFFCEHGVVLRGMFRSVVPQSPTKKLKRLFGAGRPTRRTLQSEAARMAGLNDQFLDVGHIPHPMRVGTFRKYYEEHPGDLRNASFPLRNVRQFWPIALANHLEIKNGTARMSATPESLYLSSSATLSDIERLTELERRPGCKFLCAQSLDNASEDFLEFWRAWMDRVVGRISRASS